MASLGRSLDFFWSQFAADSGLTGFILCQINPNPPPAKLESDWYCGLKMLKHPVLLTIYFSDAKFGGRGKI